jgi:hypothetical protein
MTGLVLHAQTGRFSGQVSDPQGAAVPSASLQFINQETFVKRETTSDPNGMYSLAYLPAGKYQVVVSAGNFNTFIGENVALGVDEAVVYNVQLSIGTASTEVRVEGGGATDINLGSAEVAGTITAVEVANLALNGRNFTQLITLTPGVSNQSQQDEALVGPVGQAKYSFNGGRVEYNSFEVDGSDVLNLSIYPTAAPLIVTPSLDAIQEIKVMTSNYGAMYGRTASGVVVATTKSGTDAFHGSGYEYLRNEFFNARNYFDPPNHSAPRYRRNDFGFTIGGPLYIPGVMTGAKKRMFFFFSEEARLEQTPTPYRVGAPDANELKGDFSEFCPPPGSPADSKTYPYCPYFAPDGVTYADGFKRDRADGNMFAILGTGLIPAANSQGGCNSSVNLCYVASVSPSTNWREELFRLDYDVTSRHRVSARYIHDAWDTTVLSPQWGFLGSRNTYPTVRNRFTGPGINVIGGLASTLTQSLLNNLVFSYTNSEIRLTGETGLGANLARPSQLDATTCDPAFQAGASTGCPLGYVFGNGFGGKLPALVATGVGADFGGGNLLMDTGYTPWQHTSPTYNLTDNATKIMGKHTIQGGTQVILLERNQTNSAVGSANGDVQGVISFAENSPKNTPAALLEAAGNINYQQDSAQGRFHQYALVAEPYLQDDYKMLNRLTLNLGLRLSLFGNFYERDRQLYNWDPTKFDRGITGTFHVDPTFGELVDNATQLPIPRTTGTLDPRIANGLVRCGYDGVPASCMTPKLWNWSPRIGFAWNIDGSGHMAIRGGYGIFYEHGTPYEANTGSLEANPPAVTTVEQYSNPDGLYCIGGQDSAGACTIAALKGAFPISVTAIPTKTQWADAQQWNLSVERELPWNFVATAAYVGSKGTHLTAELQLNQLQPVPSGLNPYGAHEPFVGSANNGAQCANPINGIVLETSNLAVVCASAGVFSAVAPPAYRIYAPGVDRIASIQPIANSFYHGFQFLARRTKGSLTLDAAYTYSHSIDDASDRNEIPVDGLNIRANKASSSFDQRQLFEVSYVYHLPLLSFWRVLNRPPDSDTPGVTPLPAEEGPIARALLSNWDISGLTLIQSGIPFSVYNSGGNGIAALDNAGVANGLSPLYASYPDLVGNAKKGIQYARYLGGRNASSFGPLLLNPAAFSAPRGLTFGNAGRNVLNNPGRTNFDISLLKHVNLPHERDLEFRIESFNSFNHTQFRIYDPAIGNSANNTVSCYGGAGAEYSAAGGDGADCFTGYAFLHPVDAHRSRTMQFAVKFAF